MFLFIRNESLIPKVMYLVCSFFRIMEYFFLLWWNFQIQRTNSHCSDSCIFESQVLEIISNTDYFFSSIQIKNAIQYLFHSLFSYFFIDELYFLRENRVKQHSSHQRLYMSSLPKQHYSIFDM